MLSSLMESYDFIVIGAGGTGLSAGMYGARLGMKTLVLGFNHGSELPIGGVITTTNLVENYPGFVKISGYELAKKLETHARSYDLVTIKNELVTEVKKDKNKFLVETKKGKYNGKVILFATGTKWKKLGAKGGREFENKGVTYCALCDAPLYKNKVVAVVGGGDSASKDALVLAEHAKKVFMICRGEKINSEKINLEKIKQNKKIEIIPNTEIIEVKGDDTISSVVLNKEYHGKNELSVDGIFVAIGHVALSDLAKKIGVQTNSRDEIIINHKTCETNVPGVFAAGDVTDNSFKQLITGVAEGCTSAYYAYEFVTKNKLGE